MKESKCVWPGCGKAKFMHTNIPLVKQSEDGKFQPVENITVPTALCKYHFALGSICVALQNPKDEKQRVLMGPFNEINVVEAVMVGMIMSGKFEELQKNKETADQQEKEFAKKLEKKREENVKETDTGKPKEVKPSDNSRNK